MRGALEGCFALGGGAPDQCRPGGESLFPEAGEPEAEPGEGGVVEQELEADLVAAEPGGAVGGEDVAEDGGEGADERHPAVPDASRRENAEEEEAQQRPVGVARDGVDGVDHAPVADGFEAQDHQPHHDGGACVDPAPGAPQARLVLPDVGVQEVHREGGGERGERGAGTAEGRGGDAEGEQQADDGRHESVPGGVRAAGDGREEVVRLRHADAALRGELIQQHAEGEEEQVDRNEGGAVAHHIALAFAQGLAGQILLHHVLVHAGHRHGGQRAGCELLPEQARVLPVVEEPDPAHPAVADAADHSAEVQPHHPADLHQAQDHHREQRERLEHVGPDQRAHAAAEGVQPHAEHRGGHVDPHRNAQRLEDDELQHDGREVHPHAAEQELGQEEETGPGAVAPAAETVFQIDV